MQKENIVLSTIVAVLSVVGTCFAISSQFITKPTFLEFKGGIIQRLDRLEKGQDLVNSKLDRLLENRKGR